jgi:ATP-dependent exoDNAse (exonuclease V) beta subunit
MTEEPLHDASARATALDPARSFIVQAPAGSGKTGLLIQRTLTLLAQVDYPEEVLAITFTRKAAAEMRERLVRALESVALGPPAGAYERQTFECARVVVARDEALGWGLMLNPSRLRVMTIDALCASLVAQMPVLSRFGGMLELVTQADRLYLRAARRLLGSLEDDSPVRGELQILMQHLDNHQSRIESLLVEMLRHRDRWLPLVAGDQRPDLTREALEDTLRACIETGQQAAADAVPDDLVEPLTEIVARAAAQCAADQPLCACAALDAIPSADVANRRLWDGIVDFLLTQKNEPRRRLTAAQGILAPSATRDKDDKAQRANLKQAAQELLARVGETPALVRALAALRTLPPATYSEEEWRLLNALQTLLPVAAAQLKVLFQERGQVDFTEQSHRALAALGTADAPTDLALALDYRISHLLLDEFQDTSRTQYELIECLVRGWEPDDGRTLFLVGDPMQSIYRFRDAEVGLFMHARAHGLGDVALESLTLSANFRTRADLVERNNEVFTRVFPERDSIEDSSVAYTPASAQRGAGGNLAVHAFSDQSGQAEAERVAHCVRDALARGAAASVAILVRNRSHLSRILAVLTRDGQSYHAVDILPLKTSAVVIDLWALTRALLHLGDRTAWLSVLRAPWCGLTLDDLFAVAGNAAQPGVWELMLNESRRQMLSADGNARLARVKGVLDRALADKGRRGLRRWVEGTWTALGGPACITNAADMDNAATFFDLLEGFEDVGGFDSLEDLARAVDGLFAATRADADTRLSVMTIHKAKGLEFDCVIVPGLDRVGPGDDRALLQWLELTDARGRARRLLAPINASDAEDQIGRYVRDVQKRRDRSESLRLLYVAATRARESLHLMTRIAMDDQRQPRAPQPRSLASLLWPALGHDFVAALEHDETATATVGEGALTSAIEPATLVRLPAQWAAPPVPPPQPWHARDMLLPAEAHDRPDWGGDTARHVGTTVHRVLQQVATEGQDNWSARWTDGLDDYLARMLANLGVLPDELTTATVRAGVAVRNTLSDERGRWVVAQHRNGRTEWPLSGWVDGRVRNVVLDRSFVDDAGMRWIVDYKTAQHEAGMVEAFMDTEVQRYRPQLELYARILQRVDETPIRLGIYFPMLQGWREWPFKGMTFHQAT